MGGACRGQLRERPDNSMQRTTLRAVADVESPWNMNHDGFRGTLIISDSKMDCASPPWCALVLKYVDSKGKQWSGKIDKIDQKFQHMTFHINFPGNNQKFDAYLFSWDKNKMAGITYWGGRTFGLFATK